MGQLFRKLKHSNGSLFHHSSYGGGIFHINPLSDRHNTGLIAQKWLCQIIVMYLLNSQNNKGTASQGNYIFVWTVQSGHHEHSAQICSQRQFFNNY